MTRDSQRYYPRIAKAIQFIIDNQTHQPGLGELAHYMGMSESRLQRLFSEWVGVSPKQFLLYLNKEKAKGLLRQCTLMDAAYYCGLSGTGRLHDLFIKCESMTPGEYRNMGSGLRIRFGFHDSPLGICFIAQTERGICKLAFLDAQEQRQQAVDELELEWPNAELIEDSEYTMAIYSLIFQDDMSAVQSLKLLLKGSPFQVRVWEALLRIPYGSVCSYQQVASQIGQPSATRAVASAIARNNIAYLIPCHRVIRSTGIINQYRWGASRKAALIGWEQARRV